MNQDNQPEALATSENPVNNETLESDIVNENDAPVAQSVFKPETFSRFDIVESQERTRANLAKYLVYGLGLTLVAIGAFVTYAPSGEKADNDRELITLIWTSEVTLVSSALGFYFGSQTKGR